MGRIICIFLLLLCTSCATDKVVTNVETVEVKVPVFTCPASAAQLTVPTRPMLLKDTLSINDKNNPGRVAQAYLVDIQALIVYAQSLEYNARTLDTLCKNSNIQ